MVEREALSLSPSLLLQGDMGMGKPHSLLAMHASATERQTCDHDWYRGKQPKRQHVVNFQTTETRQLPLIRPRVKIHKELPLVVEKLRT